MTKRLLLVVALSIGACAGAVGRSSDPGTGDWPMWGGTPDRNMVSNMKNLPSEWDIKTKKNVKWVAKLGSQSYGNPVVANGKVYIGTNNGHGWLKRYPASVDLGCLLAFEQKDGKFLWQHSSEKLPTGRVHDWPLQGICCSPLDIWCGQRSAQWSTPRVVSSSSALRFRSVRGTPAMVIGRSTTWRAVR